MKKPGICLALIGQMILIPAFLASAEDGVRMGTTWTDAAGNNYEGDPTPASSAPSSGPSYYIPTWEERRENNRLRAEAKRQAQATKINDQGVEYAKKGDYKKALEFYEKAAAIDPTNAVIQNNILSSKGTALNEEGLQYYTAGNYQMAADSYRRALELKPDSDVIRQNLADAERELSYQQEWQRKEDLKKAEMGVAGDKIKGMLTTLSQDLKKPTAQPSGLSFKPAEAPKTGYEGDHQIARKDELAFKGMEVRKPALEAVAPVPIEGSKTVLGQAKSAEFHSGVAAKSGSYEGMKGNSAIGFDTKGVPGDELASPAVRVPEVGEGVSLVEILPPPVSKEQTTPAIEKFETERGELFTKRKEIETKVGEMEKAEKPDAVAIVKLKDEATQIKNKENFLSFQITEELTKTPEAKIEASAVSPVTEGSKAKQ